MPPTAPHAKARIRITRSVFISLTEAGDLEAAPKDNVTLNRLICPRCRKKRWWRRDSESHSFTISTTKAERAVVGDV